MGRFPMDAARRAGPMFTTGKRVEVSLEKEDYRGVWFPALVLDSGNESFLVEYHNPGNTNKEGLVVVTVDHRHIRPTPPHLKDKKFGLLEKVDAFYDFGWWSGVITKELRDGRYIVFFKHSNKERKHSHSELRPHMEWKGGKWFTASQSAEEVSGELGNQASNTVNKREREPESQTSVPQASARPKLQPSSSQASAGGKFSGVLQQFTRQRGKILGDAAGKAAEDLIEKDCVIKEVDIPVIQSLKNNGIGSSCARKPSLSPDKETQTLPRDQKQLVDDDPSTQKIMGSNELEGFAERTKTFLGSSILPAKSPETPVEVEKQNGDVAAVEPMVKDCTNDDIHCSVTAASTEASIPSKECRKPNGDGENQLNSPLKPEKQSTIMNKTPVKKIRPKRKCVLLASKKQLDVQHTSNRGRRRTISINTNSPIQDSQNVSSVGKAAEIIEKDVSVKVAEMDRPSDRSDDQPISMFIDGKQSPTTVDGPKCSIIRTVDECIERQKETGMELTAVNDEGESQQDENQSIPFVKNTLLWKTIESMEVFRVMPQKPHFQNLGSFKETSREGLAIGSMVNFSSVVENTSKLQYDDSRSIIEDNLDTLVELESFGFDVRLVRDRLTRLLLIKDKQEELEERSKEIKSRINEHELETSNIDKEIDEIDKRMKELQERRAVAVSKKEKRGSEISSLESTAECIDDGMRSARLDFVSLAAAPW